MDFYSLFKFLHVASVIVWIGGGLALAVLGTLAERARNNERFGRMVETVVLLSPRLFVPASVAAFVFGALTTYLAWNLSYLWIWIGLAGFAVTFGTGIFVLGPRAEVLTKMIAAEGYSDRMVAHGSRVLAVVKFDYLMLFVVVADMVYKPTLSDWPILVAFAVVLALGGAYFFFPILRARGAVVPRSVPPPR